MKNTKNIANARIIDAGESQDVDEYAGLPANATGKFTPNPYKLAKIMTVNTCRARNTVFVKQ